ncbi:MAG: phosphodiester glycosidase family protein [bacterium]
MANKKKTTEKNKFKWIFRISLFLLITLFVLVFISFNSTYLINEVMRYIFIVIMILSVGSMVYTFKKFKKSKIFIGLFTVYALGCGIFLNVVYNNDSFKDWFITTALATNSHEYYANILYSDKDIEKVKDNNYIIEPEEDTDETLVDTSLSDVVFKEEVTYENEYEEAVLDREEGTKFKLIEFEVNGQDAYLGVIYNPEDVHVGVTQYLGVRGEYVTAMAERYEASLAINAGRFYDPSYSGAGGTPSGITIVDGAVITGTGSTNTKVIGFNENDILMLIDNCTVAQAQANGIRDAVYSTPFLIVNGTPAFIAGNGGWGMAARTAIGQRADGIVLFLVVDSNEFRTSGADMSDLTEIMLNYGAINAANLDGGTSSVMALNYELINDPIDSSLAHQTRPVATLFYVN